jgi:hypothetical protein
MDFGAATAYRINENFDASSLAKSSQIHHDDVF